MARVNVYLPDRLSAEAKAAGLNISHLAQEAIRSALAADSLASWQHRVAKLDPANIDHDSVLLAVAEAKAELDGG